VKVALLGLGNMGSGIADSLLNAGFDLTVWNRTQSKMQPFIDRGASGAEIPGQAAIGADLVLTSLMDDRSILDVLEGENGILAAMKPGSVHVCVTTISPRFADELAENHRAHGTHFVAAPVLGRPEAAADGTLMSFMAGDKDGLDTAMPVCQAFTQTAVAVGQKASVAATLKLCLNYSIISIIELMGEVYACAEKAGVDVDLLEGLYQSMFAHPVLKMYAGKIRDRAYDDGGFRMTGGLKDVRLMREAAESCGARFDIAGIIEAKMTAALEQGMANKDWSAICEISRQQAGLE
jgi:3-hydroxyisobutyrate dehydrogenase-like beta-hydroxyacid dehydrogenase